MSHVTLKIKISISPPEQTQHLYLRAQGSLYLGLLISAAFDSSSVSGESARALITRVCPAPFRRLGGSAPPWFCQLNPDPHCLQRGAALSAAGRGTGEHPGRHPPGYPPRVGAARPEPRAEPGGLPGAGGRRPRSFPGPTRGVPTPPGPAWAGLGRPRSTAPEGTAPG